MKIKREICFGYSDNEFYPYTSHKANVGDWWGNDIVQGYSNLVFLIIQTMEENNVSFPQKECSIDFSFKLLDNPHIKYEIKDTIEIFYSDRLEEYVLLDNCEYTLVIKGEYAFKIKIK